MGRDHDEWTARTHTHTSAHTQQLSLVFRGKSDPTRTPWVLGEPRQERKEGRERWEREEEEGEMMQMVEGEGRKEGRKDFLHIKLVSICFLPLLHSLIQTDILHKVLRGYYNRTRSKVIALYFTVWKF